MKKWALKFWRYHGERIIFLSAALVMASIFTLFPEFKESGKTVLIGILMMFYNKARSPKDDDDGTRETTKKVD